MHCVTQCVGLNPRKSSQSCFLLLQLLFAYGAMSDALLAKNFGPASISHTLTIFEGHA